MKEIDSAIIKALGISADQASIKSHSCSGFSQTLKLTIAKDEGTKEFFVKVGGKDSETMFEGLSKMQWNFGKTGD